MVGKRTVGGNTTYFLGEVSRSSWRAYFPVVYLIKEPLAIHVLSLAAVLILLSTLWRRPRVINLEPMKDRIVSYTRTYFIEVVLGLFIAFYWLVSIAANLNIGVRHIIPVFPFTFLLVSRIILGYLHKRPNLEFDLSSNTAKELTSFYINKFWKYVALFIVVLWYIISPLSQYPLFTSYFNELVGGQKNGYKYIADSNLDWGQDLKRLAQFVEENNIDKIHLNYFGGGFPAYYLGDKYISWWSARGPEKGWHAVSATFLDEAFGTPVGIYKRTEQDSYLWLHDKEPIAMVGNSIFVFRLE